MLMHYIGVRHLKRTRQSSRETKARSPSQHSIEVADELHLVVVVTHLVHCGIVLKSSFEILNYIFFLKSSVFEIWFCFVLCGVPENRCPVPKHTMQRSGPFVVIFSIRVPAQGCSAAAAAVAVAAAAAAVASTETAA